MMVGCVSSATKVNQNQDKRIYIPQEQVTFTRPIPNKVEPNSYRQWLNQGESYARVREIFTNMYWVEKRIRNCLTSVSLKNQPSGLLTSVRPKRLRNKEFLIVRSVRWGIMPTKPVFTNFQKWMPTM
jgi:hypothetical protein